MVMAYAEALTEPDIDFARTVWQWTREDKLFPAVGVLWLFGPESGEWHLVLATPRVDEIGLRRAYEELARVTGRVPSNSVHQLSRIQLVSPKQPSYQALRSVFGKTASVEGVRLGNTQIGGLYINDAYLYEVR
jgi:hypothetical protein